MQSASVLIETAATAGQRPTQINESSSRTGGGLFGHELKQQQQQQIEEQRSLDSKSSSNAEDGVASRSNDSPETASNSERSEDTAQQNGGDSTTDSQVADSDSSAESGYVEQSAGVDGDEGEVSEEGVSIHNRFNQLKMVEMPTSESAEAVVSESDDGLSLQPVSEDGAESVVLESAVVDESGNILPLNVQNGDSMEGDEGIKDIGALSLAVQEDGENITIEEEMIPANTEIDIGQESLAINEPKQEQTDKKAVIDVEGENRAAVITTSEQTVVDKQMSGEAAPALQAVVSVPANSSPTALSSNNASLTPSGGVAAVTNATANQSAGMGAGSDNSNNSNSMAGRQQPTNLGAMLAEGEAEGELAQPSDKTTAFLAALKSVAKDGGKGVDVQSVAQTGVKSQSSQVSQMITQLSSLQSVSQSQASTATTAAPTALSAAGSTPALMTIATSMRQQGWDRAMGERLVFMARNGIQEAQIQVNPRHLGPIDIKVSVNQEHQTHVTFVTSTNAARETVDAAMPRLREMFDQAGLNLAESEVSQRDQQQSGKGEAADDEAASNGLVANGVEGEEDEPITQQVGYVRPSALDLFA